MESIVSKHKTELLTGDLLNLVVAKALGYTENFPCYEENGKSVFLIHEMSYESCFPVFNPSEKWEQCGQLIERFKIESEYINDSAWCISLWNKDGKRIAVKDKDLKTAICRCVVKSVFGDEVEL